MERKNTEMIDPEIKELIDSYKKLLKENKRLQAENRRHIAYLKNLFLEFRRLIAKKPKSN